MNAITQELGAQVIPIDGKSLRGSYDREAKQKPLTVVSAWASSHRLVLGQLKVNDKSNEITAIPELLKMLNINGRGLASIGMVVCERRLWNKTTIEVRYYLSSLKADAIRLSSCRANSLGNRKLSSLDNRCNFRREDARGGRQLLHYFCQPPLVSEVVSARNAIERLWIISTRSKYFLLKTGCCNSKSFLIFPPSLLIMIIKRAARKRKQCFFFLD